MVVTEQLFALSKAYPVISAVIGAVLFFIGLRVAGKILKWALWALAAVAVVAAGYMMTL